MSDRTPSFPGRTFSFGPFRLFPAQQLLLEGDRPVRLGSRAFDLLVALIERAGELVTKEDLVAHVWPNTYVEEGNLRVHIAALRKALADGQDGRRYVANVPGRGYRFLAPVSVETDPASHAPQPPDIDPSHNLPARPARIIGRDEVIHALAKQLPERRFITLVGPGGIGKTTVALAVADRSAVAYRDGVRYVDLAPVGDPRLVPSALPRSGWRSDRRIRSRG